jgi:hypothetical protein
MLANQPQPGPTGRATTSNFLWGQLGGFGARRTHRCPHNPKVAGSNPTPATKKSKGLRLATVAPWFFNPTFGSRSPLKNWSAADGPSGRLRTVRCWTALVRLARRPTLHQQAGSRYEGAARRAGWTCDSFRRICGAHLQRSPLCTHRAEHDLGYLPRALSNPSDLTAGTPRIHVHALVTALSRPTRRFESRWSHHPPSHCAISNQCPSL